jgi:fibro-slime domain-containing protein
MAASLNLEEFCPSDVGCLQKNTEYPLDIFHCERQTSHSNFKMTTLGIKLITADRPPPPPPRL